MITGAGFFCISFYINFFPQQKLVSFFEEFEGDQPPEGNFTKIIAINEGKLRDFILNKAQYKWLGKQVHHYLEYDNFIPHESLIFINLNFRSVVEHNADKCILELLVDKLITSESSQDIWNHCSLENCKYSESCYVKYNIDVLCDPIKGKIVLERLKSLILAVHLRKLRHITMRDIRSILSLILFNKFQCSQIQNAIDSDDLIIERFYYNSVFSSDEQDRISRILSEIDVAKTCNPKLDNFIHFHEPDGVEVRSLFIQGENEVSTDLEHLKSLYKERPEGTYDNDPSKLLAAKLYHATMRRKLFFEGDEKKMRQAGLPTWKELLPYKQFDRFLEVLETGVDEGNYFRDNLTLAISKSERIYNEIVGNENLCLRSSNQKRAETKAFYSFPASEFKIVIKDIGYQREFLEYMPNCIYYKHIDNSAELEIPLDMLELLFRIRDGYMPTANEMRSFFLNLEMFKRHIASKSSDRIILTEDDSNLYEIRRDSYQRLIMSKVGG